MSGKTPIEQIIRDQGKDGLKKALEKADFSTGAELTPDQAEEWNVLIQGESTFLNGDQARIETPTKLQTRVQSLHFGEPITISADETDDGAETGKPKTSGVDTDAKKVKVRTNLTYEAILNAVGGEKKFVSIVLDAIKRRAALDIEMLAFLGDEDAYAGNTTPLGKLLVRRDGWVTRARTDCRVLDAGGEFLTPDILQEAIDSMPNQLWTPKTKWLMNKGILGDFRRLLYAKSGGDILAASLLNSAEDMKPLGEDLTQVPVLPNNMEITTQDATPAQVYGLEFGPFLFTTADNKIKLTIGGVTKTITMTAGKVVYATAVANAINSEFGKRYARDWGGRLLISTIATGVATEIVVETQAQHAYTLLGLTAGTYNGANADSNGVVYEGTVLFLADPTNFVAIHPNRENRLTVKYDEDVDGIKIVMYDHWDFRFDNPDSVVMIDNLRKRRSL